MVEPKIVGMLRIKNEARWIGEVIESLLPLCGHVFVLDDHSTDRTPAICRSFGERLTLWESPFHGLDESRDKNWLLGRTLEKSDPDWILLVDGDEILSPESVDILRRECSIGTARAWSLRILYLWERRDLVRMDGVYGKFRRPSLFRPTPGQSFMGTSAGGNFHCSSIPSELFSVVSLSEARLLHLGYMLREDRLRKFRWYNERDPHNAMEDGYKHMVLGDLPEYPASLKTHWAGPLRLEALT